MRKRLSESSFFEKEATIIVSLYRIEAVEFATLYKLLYKDMKNISKKGDLAGIPIINFHAAGIDVGSMSMAVSYTDQSGQLCVTETGCYTRDLHELVLVLRQEGITDVAMEATGVYWMSLYELLEDAGIQVTLINPGHYKNSANQKTDIKDCQWIHQYHSCGILRKSHIAPDLFRELRTYIHERNMIQKHKSVTLNRIHRLLSLMNIKYQHIISDIEGVNSMKILHAIASGIRNPHEIISLTDLHQFKATEEEFLRALDGLYKEQFIAMLKMKLKEYDFLVGQMRAYEEYIEGVLIKLEEVSAKPVEVEKTAEKPAVVKKGRPRKKAEGEDKYVRKNQYSFHAKGYLHRIVGVDLTKIEGIEEKGLLDILSVTGTDMSKWPTAQHFASYLGLSPRRKISGGKFLGHEKRSNNNPAAQAFRLSAHSLSGSNCALGVLYRRLSNKNGPKTANKAVARKLAVLVYTLIKNQSEYDASLRMEQTLKQQQRQEKNLKKMAEKMGYTLTKTT
jgi:transposase